MRNCEFSFTRQPPIYQSGEIVEGQVMYTNSINTKYDKLFIRLEGKAKLKWQQGKNYVVGEEQFIDERIILHDAKGTLPPGQHEWRFSFPTANNCPTSFEHKFGKIIYKIHFVIYRSLWINESFKEPFQMWKPFENLSPLRFSLVGTLSTATKLQHHFCWPCITNQICARLTTTYGAYAPGETIKYTIEIEHNVSDILRVIKVKFRKIIEFTISQYSKQIVKETLVEKLHCDDLNQSILHVMGEIEVPADLVGISTTSVNITYWLKVVLVREATLSRNIRLSVPILIGTEDAIAIERY